MLGSLEVCVHGLEIMQLLLHQSPLPEKHEAQDHPQYFTLTGAGIHAIPHTDPDAQIVFLGFGQVACGMLAHHDLMGWVPQ
jgi:hypothetical protein